MKMVSLDDSNIKTMFCMSVKLVSSVKHIFLQEHSNYNICGSHVFGTFFFLLVRVANAKAPAGGAARASAFHSMLSMIIDALSSTLS